MQMLSFLTTFVYVSLGVAQETSAQPIAQICTPSLPRVVCINNYAAVMPYPFSRPFSTDFGHVYDFTNTEIPNDKSFGLVNNSDFLVFDRERGLELLGPNPSFEIIFNDTAQHEGPVYVPELNKIYVLKVSHPSECMDQSLNNVGSCSRTIHPRSLSHWKSST